MDYKKVIKEVQETTLWHTLTERFISRWSVMNLIKDYLCLAAKDTPEIIIADPFKIGNEKCAIQIWYPEGEVVQILYEARARKIIYYEVRKK